MTGVAVEEWRFGAAFRSSPNSAGFSPGGRQGLKAVLSYRSNTRR